MTATIVLREVVVREGPPQWFSSDDAQAVAIARSIGLPTLTTANGHVAVFLPGPLREHYAAKATAANVTLVWERS